MSPIGEKKNGMRGIPKRGETTCNGEKNVKLNIKIVFALNNFHSLYTKLYSVLIKSLGCFPNIKINAKLCSFCTLTV